MISSKLTLSFISLLLILERGEGMEKERERNVDQLPLEYTLTGDHTRHPGICADWESNRHPFGL